MFVHRTYTKIVINSISIKQKKNSSTDSIESKQETKNQIEHLPKTLKKPIDETSPTSF